jgi:hypothetical protein
MHKVVGPFTALLNLPAQPLAVETTSTKKCVGWKLTQEVPEQSQLVVLVDNQIKMDYATLHAKLAILAKVQYVGKIALQDLEMMVLFVVSLQPMAVEEDILGNLAMDLMTGACTKDVMQHMVQAIVQRMVQLYILIADQDTTT